MSRKVITALAPVAALIAFAIVPALASATKMQVDGKEAANGAQAAAQGEIYGEVFKEAEPTVDLNCMNSEFDGTLTENNKETLDIKVSAARGYNCKANGFTTHVTSNASAAEPWQLEVQQPKEDKTFVVHLQPATGKTIQLSAQPQFMGTSVATCDYASKDLQGSGVEGGSVTFAYQAFKKEAGEEFCGTELQLTGTLAFEDGVAALEEEAPKLVTFDMK